MEADFSNYLLEKAQVDETHLTRILEYSKEREFQKGEFLLSKGQVCLHAFYVEKGLLRFYSIDPLGKEHIIQFAPETWLLSDRGSVFFNLPSEFYIDAIEDSKVYLLDQAFFKLAKDISPSFRDYNEFLLHNHIRHMQSRINLLIGATAESRYLDFIKLYPDLTFRVPQWMIASYLGITPESLSRVRKDLAHRNFRPQ
jgi:CRP/FNR family transcriptional regulator, anaerobic regulatory protein